MKANPYRRRTSFRRFDNGTFVNKALAIMHPYPQGARWHGAGSAGGVRFWERSALQGAQVIVSDRELARDAALLRPVLAACIRRNRMWTRVNRLLQRQYGPKDYFKPGIPSIYYCNKHVPGFHEAWLELKRLKPLLAAAEIRYEQAYAAMPRLT